MASLNATDQLEYVVKVTDTLGKAPILILFTLEYVASIEAGNFFLLVHT